jgi:phosphoribosyl-AMP cyclohydrolase
MNSKSWIDEIKFNSDGLVPVIAQDAEDGTILMLAYMNRKALEETVRTKRATYWSRSRNKFWIKGEESGNIQNVKEILVDCDGDTLVLKIEQVGKAACHTGHRSCLYRILKNDNQWEVQGKPLFDPKKVYGQ